jgi:hypothetical protein
LLEGLLLPEPAASDPSSFTTTTPLQSIRRYLEAHAARLPAAATALAALPRIERRHGGGGGNNGGNNNNNSSNNAAFAAASLLLDASLEDALRGVEQAAEAAGYAGAWDARQLLAPPAVAARLLRPPPPMPLVVVAAEAAAVPAFAPAPPPMLLAPRSPDAVTGGVGSRPPSALQQRQSSWALPDTVSRLFGGGGGGGGASAAANANAAPSAHLPDELLRFSGGRGGAATASAAATLSSAESALGEARALMAAMGLVKRGEGG